MPTPTTHIVLANKVYNKYFSNLNFDDFIVGNCFPDIRYFLKIDKTKTHFAKIEDIKISKSDNSFTIGTKFHNLVDLRRKEYYMNKEEVIYLVNKYLKNFNIEDIDLSIKLLEEGVLYKKMDDWEYFFNIFKSYEPINLNCNGYIINKDNIVEWNNFLINDIKKDKNDIKKILPPDLTKDTIQKNIKLFNIIKNNKEFIKIVNNFYNDFENIIEDKLILDGFITS